MKQTVDVSVAGIASFYRKKTRSTYPGTVIVSYLRGPVDSVPWEWTQIQSVPKRRIFCPSLPYYQKLFPLRIGTSTLQIFALLGCYAAYSVSFWRFGTTNRSHIRGSVSQRGLLQVHMDCLILNYVTGRLSRNVGNFQSTLRNIPEERRPHSLRGESLKLSVANCIFKKQRIVCARFIILVASNVTSS